jgi:hypothetical protein
MLGEKLAERVRASRVSTMSKLKPACPAGRLRPPNHTCEIEFRRRNAGYLAAWQ